MATNDSHKNRRQFLKTAGAAGLGSVLGGNTLTAEEKQASSDSSQKNEDKGTPQVPRRVLGKTGVKVPVLGLGGGFNAVDNQMILRKAYQFGVTYWDTSHMYSGGNNELGIGKFLGQFPQMRKDLFIVTKASGAKDVKKVQSRFETSLERMKTDYIDLYYGVHALNDPARLTTELRDWAMEAKEKGLIRYFGFSTHKNMPECLHAAAEMDWIDVVMATYNFRLAENAEMQRALDACHKANIGLIAMKTQAKRTEADHADQETLKPFIDSGYTPEQAKIKFALDDERFTSAVVAQSRVEYLNLNVAAVLERTTLSKREKDTMITYARNTCSGYCAGCSGICGGAIPRTRGHISDLMRALMYENGYADHNAARRTFATIPADLRQRLAYIDYTRAEKLCPQGMPIGMLVRKALEKFA